MRSGTVRIPWRWSQAFYETCNRLHEARYGAIRAYHSMVMEGRETMEHDIPAILEEADRCRTGG